MIILRFVQGVGTLHPGLDVHLGLVGLPGAAAAEVGPHEAQRTPGLHVPGRGFPGPIRGEHPASSPPITAHLVWLLPLLPAVMGPTGGSGGAVAAAAGDILLTGATLGSETGGGSEQSRGWWPDSGRATPCTRQDEGSSSWDRTWRTVWTMLTWPSVMVVQLGRNKVSILLIV